MRMYAAEGGAGLSHFDADWTSPSALVVGAEARGETKKRHAGQKREGRWFWGADCFLAGGAFAADSIRSWCFATEKLPHGCCAPKPHPTPPPLTPRVLCTVKSQVSSVLCLLLVFVVQPPSASLARAHSFPSISSTFPEEEAKNVLE